MYLSRPIKFLSARFPIFASFAHRVHFQGVGSRSTPDDVIGGGGRASGAGLTHDTRVPAEGTVGPQGAGGVDRGWLGWGGAGDAGGTEGTGL